MLAYTINTDACVMCGICKMNCPVDAIGFNADGYREINQDVCVECGTCADNCPAAAIEET